MKETPEPWTAEYVVVDVETTGLGPDARVIEFACAVVGVDRAIRPGFQTLVNPERSTGPVWLHGLAAADVRFAPRFIDVAGRIERELRDRIHVGHCLAFDRSVLEREFQAVGVAFPRTHFGICTADLASRVLGVRSLAAACRALGIDQAEPHRAGSDAWAAARLLVALIDHLPRRQPCPPFPGAWRLPPPAAPARRAEVRQDAGIGGFAGWEGEA